MAGTALEKVTVLQGNLQRMSEHLTKLAPPWFTVDRIIAGVLTAAAKDPNLYEADPKSLYVALSRAARWGLDIGDGVDLVIIGGKVEAWPSYQGLKALLMREKMIRGAQEYVIYEGEHYEYEAGFEPRLVHRPERGAVGRQIIAAYSLIALPQGERTFNLVWIDEIEAVRSKSRSWKNGACPPWYAQKTAFRNWVNKQPKSGMTGAIRDAVRFDDAQPTPPMVDEDGVITGELAA